MAIFFKSLQRLVEWIIDQVEEMLTGGSGATAKMLLYLRVNTCMKCLLFDILLLLPWFGLRTSHIEPLYPVADHLVSHDTVCQHQS